jgi:hypothetical protein
LGTDRQRIRRALQVRDDRDGEADGGDHCDDGRGPRAAAPASSSGVRDSTSRVISSRAGGVVGVHRSGRISRPRTATGTR